MHDLERSLDALQPRDPGALPAPLVTALRTTRRKRRVALAGAGAGVLLPVLAIAVSLLRPTPAAQPGPSPSPLSPTSLASLSRLNRDADYDHLTLPTVRVSFQGVAPRTDPATLQLGDPALN